MTYNEQIEEAKQKIAEINEEFKALRQKKTAVTDATELKAINKQINALQHEIGKLKSDIRQYASLNRDAIREWREMVLGGGYGLRCQYLKTFL